MEKRMNLIQVLQSSIRYFIIGLLNCQPFTISELHRRICKIISINKEEKVDYKSVYKQVIILKKNGYVTIKKDKKKQGKPVLVSLINKKDAEDLHELFNRFCEERDEERNPT